MIIESDAIELLKGIEGSQNTVVITDPDWDAVYPWRTFLAQCMKVTQMGTTVVMWNAAPKQLHTLLDYAQDIEYTVKHIFPWAKPNGSQPTGWGLSRRWEAIVWFDNRPKRRGELKFLADVFTVPRITRVSREDLGHRWQKPRDLCEILIRGFSRPGDVVVDPFCGTGVILAEAKARGRIPVGGDISAKWAAHAEALVSGTSLPRKGDLF